MIEPRYFKADASTWVIRTAGGQTQASGLGLSFFYNRARTSVAALPMNVQAAPFIFNLQTSDFQEVTVQGELTWQIDDPEKTAQLFNFTVEDHAKDYLSEDPMKLNDRVIRTAQVLIDARVRASVLQDVLPIGQSLINVVREGMQASGVLDNLGLKLIDVAITRLAPTAETARALEATTREAILQQADDATYSRRKSAVEQERSIRDAELQTELSVQQKQQEIENKRVDNERELLRGRFETEQERIAANIATENQRQEFVSMRAQNSNTEADTQAYAINAKMAAYRNLPIEHLKAIAMTQMAPEQLFALAMESFANNANKIGELNIGPDIFGQAFQRAVDRKQPEPNKSMHHSKEGR